MMPFHFGRDSQAHSFSNGSKETCFCGRCSSKPQPAPPPSVFDWSSFTNFPATQHLFHPGMAKSPAGVAQPAMFLPVFVLQVMPVLFSGGSAVTISQFPGSAPMAHPFIEPPKAPVFGHACKRCSLFPTAPTPTTTMFGGPSSATGKKVESATVLQPASFGGGNVHSAEGFWCSK